MNTLSLLEKSKIRHVFDEDRQQWYFSVIDVIEVLTGNNRPRKYWSDLKKKIITEAGNNELSEKIGQLKMESPDGKMRQTDVADAKTMLRIVQSIPSPKAEPIKQWLAQVGYERIEETADPEKSVDRARANWQNMGHSDKWIQTRLSGQDTRGKLTDYWATHDIKAGEEYAFLTNVIHQAWSGVSVQTHKKIKGLKRENLRDHMTEAELLFTALAELTTRQIAESTNATGVAENKTAAMRGGKVAKNARLDYEKQTGQKVITSQDPTKHKQIKGE